MFLKNIYLAVCATLLIVKPVWADIETEYYVFDKLLHGTYSCIRDTSVPYNMGCDIPQYIHLSGWMREGSEEVPADISETTVYAEISAEFFLNRVKIDEFYTLKECKRAMNLVKSNPSKWDLKIGTSWSNVLTYCEAVNQSLMQQYYAEQE